MTLIKDLRFFLGSMSTLPWNIQIWAALYPLPQLIGGLLFIYTTPGLVIFLGRVTSFIISSQVHKRQPFSKLIGPIGHSIWLLIVPYLIHELLNNELSPALYWFVCYVLLTTFISAAIDVKDTVSYLKGNKGEYKR